MKVTNYLILFLDNYTNRAQKCGKYNTDLVFYASAAWLLVW